jgi:hypothetical protein
MTFKATLIALLSLYSTLFYAQTPLTMTSDSVEKLMEKRYKGGKKGFFTDLSQNIRYPMEARENCRTGVVLAYMKIRPSGGIDSILFNNDVELGMGIEAELARCLLLTKGKWLKSEEYTTFNFSVGFLIEGNDKLKATISVVAYGWPTEKCPTNNELIKQLEKAQKKEKYKEAIVLCEDLLRRLPNSEEYKKELENLKAKLK